MGFISARCTQCGANILVDESKEAGICNHCGTAFVTETVIINYTTYVTNNLVLNGEFNPESIGLMSLELAEKECDELFRIKDFSTLDKLADEIKEKFQHHI